MTVERSAARAEAEIRAIMDDGVEAVRAKDVDRATAHYAPDVLTFDVINPLQHSGLDAARRRTAAWFSSFTGPIGYELRDLTIVAAEDVAFCHSLNQVNGIKTDGQKLEMWWRATVCCRKIGGTWKITHQHSSVPFDGESGRASLDLKP